MERNNINTPDRPLQQNTMVSMRDVLMVCVSNWKWFVLSLFITMGLAVLYLLKTPQVHTCTTSILIKSSENESNTEKELQELGIYQSSSNMTNEILSLSTTVIASEIVDRLSLDVNYLHEGTFHKEVVYGLDLPVTVIFEGLANDETASIRLALEADSTVTISELERNGKKAAGNVTLRLGASTNTAVGKITVLPSSSYKKGMTDNLQVIRSGRNATISQVSGRINAELRDKNSTIIDIKYKDVSIARAEDVLNTLISVYNENWIEDRNRMSVSTSAFIRDRLAVIEQELGDVDQDISQYKSTHLIPDIQEIGSVAMNQAIDAEKQSINIGNQIYMARYIRNYLMNTHDFKQLLPTNSGLGNTTLEEQINQYNEMVLKRNKHIAISSAQNPLVMDLDKNLASMKETIIHSLDNELTMLQNKQSSIQSSHSQAKARIVAKPKQEEHLLGIERQQKVKEALYLFLLQKREENELSQAFTAYNTKLIEPPHNSGLPVEPNRMNILLIALCTGLLVPCGIFFLRENMNTTVRGRKDLEPIKEIPYLGEIPLANSHKKEKWQKSDSHKEIPQTLVAEKKRDYINEAFRVVRANLEFTLNSDKNKHHVIMLTSMNPDSGKTFITLNLSTSLGIKGKKIIALDLDLRRATLSRCLGERLHGISNYLNGQESDYKPLIRRTGCIDVLPCGTIPPNPTELLYSPRLKQLLEELRKDYDYVFIDCSPVEIVADASIANPYADITLFIIRARLFDRKALTDVKQWFTEDKYKRLSVILNGTTDDYTNYGYHRYGYRYGYHYGNKEQG